MQSSQQVLIVMTYLRRYRRSNMLRKLFRNKKGQGLVEYGLIVAGVALIAAVGISVLGHKTSDLISAAATVLPGQHADDNGPIVSGKLIETAQDATDNSITLNGAGIAASSGNSRLSDNTGADFSGLILEAE